MKTCRIIPFIISCLLCLSANAQNVSVSTNAMDYANFGTLNLEASAAVARHWSVNAGVRYNPWTFGEGSEAVQNRTRTVSAGFRWWPWNVYSGWWLGGRAQWEEYNRGGITQEELVHILVQLFEFGIKANQKVKEGIEKKISLKMGGVLNRFVIEFITTAESGDRLSHRKLQKCIKEYRGDLVTEKRKHETKFLIALKRTDG